MRIAGAAQAVCLCGQCFNQFAKLYFGVLWSDEGFSKIMLAYLDGRCPKAKLKRPKTELHLVKNPLHTE